MSRHYTMKNPRIEIEFRTMEEASAKGGVFARHRAGGSVRAVALEPCVHRLGLAEDRGWPAVALRSAGAVF